ncbi:MAG: DUF2306 domain-containing protein [Planctomycetaceae bacterium]|nr:DUF2306 domain-containing protein [Planctomycetaceae bacterium]
MDTAGQRVPAVKWNLLTLLRLATVVIILKVTAEIVAGYVDYLPPDFNSEFLRGRKAYFFGSYQWAFYPHLLFGPWTLLAGLLLVSDKFRSRFPRWHSWLGRIQVASVLLVILPSGFWMALHAQGDVFVKLGFSLLSIVTGATAFMGWRLAVKRQFAAHRNWMWRNYVLLGSAVVTRIVGGAFFVCGIDGDWTYTFSAWASWLTPLLTYEVIRVLRTPATRSTISNTPATAKL